MVELRQNKLQNKRRSYQLGMHTSVLANSEPSQGFPSPIHAHQIADHSKSKIPVVLLGTEMSNIFRAYRGRLDMTYWKAEENMQVCMDAIEILNQIAFPSKPDPSAIINYVALLREVYLHAVANLKGKSISNNTRMLMMQEQWKQVEKHFLKIKPAMDQCWTNGNEPDLISIYLSIAILYAHYKDVCDEEIIRTCYDAAQRARHLSNHRIAPDVRQYCDTIEHIFFLRRQRYRNGKSEFICPEGDGKSKNYDSDTILKVCGDGQTVLSEYGKQTYRPKKVKKYLRKTDIHLPESSSNYLTSKREKVKNLHLVDKTGPTLTSRQITTFGIEPDQQHLQQSKRHIIHLNETFTTKLSEETITKETTKSIRNPRKRLKQSNSNTAETRKNTMVIVEGYAEMPLSSEDEPESGNCKYSNANLVLEECPLPNESVTLQRNIETAEVKEIVESDQNEAVQKNKNYMHNTTTVANKRTTTSSKPILTFEFSKSKLNHEHLDHFSDNIPQDAKDSLFGTVTTTAVSVETANSFEFISETQWRKLNGENDWNIADADSNKENGDENSQQQNVRDLANTDISHEDLPDKGCILKRNKEFDENVMKDSTEDETQVILSMEHETQMHTDKDGSSEHYDIEELRAGFTIEDEIIEEGSIEYRKNGSPNFQVNDLAPHQEMQTGLMISDYCSVNYANEKVLEEKVAAVEGKESWINNELSVSEKYDDVPPTTSKHESDDSESLAQEYSSGVKESRETNGSSISTVTSLDQVEVEVYIKDKKFMHSVGLKKDQNNSQGSEGQPLYRLDAATLEQQINEAIPRLKHVTQTKNILARVVEEQDNAEQQAQKTAGKMEEILAWDPLLTPNKEEVSKTVNCEVTSEKADTVWPPVISKCSSENKNSDEKINETKEETRCDHSDRSTLPISLINEQSTKETLRILTQPQCDKDVLETTVPERLQLPHFDPKLAFERRAGARQPVPVFSQNTFGSTLKMKPPQEGPPIHLGLPVIVKDLDPTRRPLSSLQSLNMRLKTPNHAEKPNFDFIFDE